MNKILKFILFIFITKTCAGERGCHPVMRNPKVNVTVKQGDDAVLPCALENPCNRKYIKVFWMSRAESGKSNGERMILERPSALEWNLRIENTMYGDQGLYKCIIKRSNPVETTIVTLTVL